MLTPALRFGHGRSKLCGTTGEENRNKVLRELHAVRCSWSGVERERERGGKGGGERRRGGGTAAGCVHAAGVAASTVLLKIQTECNINPRLRRRQDRVKEPWTAGPNRDCSVRGVGC